MTANSRSGLRILMLSLLITIAGCGEVETPEKPARLVLTVKIGGHSVKEEAFAGTIEPRYRTDLSFRVVGRILARDVEVGDLVKKGQRVAALDPTALEFALRSQRAALANAQASLANAAGSEDRQRALRDRDVTAQATFETSEQARISAEAEVTRSQSNLAKAVEQLSYAELRSDFDGVVTGISAEIGQVVGIGQTVVTVARPDVREAAVNLPESPGLEVRIGTKFDIALQIDETIHTVGEVREMAPEADSVTRSRRVLITLPLPPEQFRLGTTVTARLLDMPAPTDAVPIPSSALRERDGNATILIVDELNSTLVETKVVVANRSGETVFVSGAPQNAKVVVAGLNSLKAGDKVRLQGGVERK